MGIKYNFFNSKYSLHIAIDISLQNALLDKVPSNLRMVAVDWDDVKNKIYIYFYFDKYITGKNEDSAHSVAVIVSNDFDGETEVLEKCIRLDFPERLPFHMSNIFRRNEDYLEE